MRYGMTERSARSRDLIAHPGHERGVAQHWGHTVWKTPQQPLDAPARRATDGQERVRPLLLHFHVAVQTTDEDLDLRLPGGLSRGWHVVEHFDEHQVAVQIRDPPL